MMLFFFIIASLHVIVSPNPLILDESESDTISVEIFDENWQKLYDVQEIEVEIKPSELASVRDFEIIPKRRGLGVIAVKATKGKEKGIGYALLSVGRPSRGGRIRVKLIPERGRVNPGEEVKFEAIPVERGEKILTPSSVVWFVIPSWLGTVDSNGVFHAGNMKGAGKVVAVVEANGKVGVGTAGILVGRLSDMTIKLKLIPQFSKVDFGDTLEFRYKITKGPAEGLKLDWWVDPTYIGRMEGNKFIPVVRRGRGVVYLLVHTDDGQFGFARAVVAIGKSFRHHLHGLPPKQFHGGPPR